MAPLEGIRVVVTRPVSQAATLVSALKAAGAVVVQVPVIAITDPCDGGAALRASLASLTSRDWLVVTSPNGAARVSAELSGRIQPCRLAVIGPGTMARASDAGLRVDLVPRHAIAEGLLEVFPDPPEGGGRVVLARAAAARDLLPVGLTAQGWTVRDVAAYRTVSVAVAEDAAARCRDADVVAFTSSSTVKSLVSAVGVAGLPRLVAAIGPATAASAVKLGVVVDVEASEHTIDGLLAAIIACVGSHTAPGEALRDSQGDVVVPEADMETR